MQLPIVVFFANIINLSYNRPSLLLIHCLCGTRQVCCGTSQIIYYILVAVVVSTLHYILYYNNIITDGRIYTNITVSYTRSYIPICI